MARRRVTVRRIDPWSVLKFSFLVHLVGLLVLLLTSVVAWYFIRRLELVETLCELASQVSIQNCGVDADALFRALATLGALGVVVLTGIAVFSSFLANLIFDLTGGVELTLLDDTPVRQPGTRSRADAAATGSSGGGAAATSASSSSTDGSERSTASSGSRGASGADPSSRRPGGTGDGADGSSRGSGGSDEGDGTVTRSQGPPLFSGDGDGDGDEREDERLFGGGRTD